VNPVGDEVAAVAVVVLEVVTRGQLYTLETEHIVNIKMHELMGQLDVDMKDIIT